MAKNSGSTRAKNSRTASESRTYANTDFSTMTVDELKGQVSMLQAMAKVDATSAMKNETMKNLLAANAELQKRTNASSTSKWDADYIRSKAKEIRHFKLPKPDDQETINIKGEDFRVTHDTASGGRHILDIIRISDGRSFGRNVYTNSGHYGYITTPTKGEVAKRIRYELSRFL